MQGFQHLLIEPSHFHIGTSSGSEVVSSIIGASSCDYTRFSITIDQEYCDYCGDDLKLAGFRFGEYGSYGATIDFQNNCDETLIIEELDCRDRDSCVGMSYILPCIRLRKA